MRGRKPKPTQLRIVQGNPGKRPINEAEPEPPKATDLEVPTWLKGKVARETWEELAPLVSGMGVFTDADRVALVLLCEAWGQWRKKPVAAMASRVQSLLVEFGLTPSARSRMRVSNVPKPGGLREFLDRGGQKPQPKRRKRRAP